MKCSQCDFDSPPGMKFCGQCGGKLGSPCPQCGAENPPGFKFCGGCGSSLGATEPEAPVAEAVRGVEYPAVALQSYTPPHLSDHVLQSKIALEGERKQVTVVFCDLVGSTSLAERLGPETMHFLLNRFFELALGEVHRYEGTINQFLGDGFMALFGAPIAHEDHARRASLAALGLRKLMEERRAELGGRYGVDLKVRMGMNTGWVVVGGIGDQLRKDYTAIGDTTNLAARLQQLAEPGAILVSEETSRFLHGSAQLEPLGLLQVKGKEAPVRAFKLQSMGLLHSDQAVLGGMARSPFMGRQREMATLEELRERAAAGEGQVVGIAAEAGAGKSRLVYELCRKLWEQPALYLAGRCLSYTSGIPYLPILDMFRNDWGIGEADDPPTVVAKITASLRRAGTDVEEPLPYLLHLLGLGEGNDKVAELSPQARQARTFRVLRQMILNAGRDRLVVLVIEDLHWVDAASEEFLAFLVEGLVASRMLLILTYRSGYRPPWIGKSYATQIALSRLTDQEGHAVIQSILRRAEPSADVVGAILNKAEGNPFFLEELARSLLEHPNVTVPDTIQGVVMARIDRLPEEHKRLLQTASVLGREFSLHLLIAVWEQPETLLSLLAELKRWEFLYEEPAAEDSRLFFKHALTQEAVYQTLLTGRRQSLHAIAGHAFETQYEGRLEEVYGSLAYHYSCADMPEKAIHYLALFAAGAARRYAHAEAAKALREALSLVQHLPASPDRDRRALELMFALADSLLPLARFSETLELLAQYRDVLERSADVSCAGRYSFWSAHTHSYLGNQLEAGKLAHRAIAAAREAADRTTEGRAWYVLCRDAFWSGRFSEGIEYGQQAIARLEGADPWWQGQAYCVAGFNYYVLGRFERALEMMNRAETIWQTLQDPRLDPSWSRGYFHASIGEYELGIAECQGGLERAQDPLNTAAALGFLGYAHLEKRDLPRAIEALGESVERLQQAGMQQLLGWFSAFLAEAHLLSQCPGKALELARVALATTEKVNFRYGTGLAQRALGRIAHAAGEPDEAADWFERALESFQSIQAPFEVARTCLDLALLAGGDHGSAEASRRMSEAHGLFLELRVPRYVERTERLAADLSVPLFAYDRDAARA